MQEWLLNASENNNVEEVNDLLKQDIKMNEQDTAGRTPIMIAVYNNNPTIVKLLIDAGANINIQDNIKNNPFLYASAEGYIDILNLLIEAGADTKITNRYGGTALIPAAERGHLEIIYALLTRTNVNVNHINDLGWTALMEAVILNDGKEQQQKVIRLLIEHDADMNISDFKGVTPLQHAQEKGYVAIESILEYAGANK